MMKDKVLISLQRNFKRVFKDEFDDPNECFLDFMLDLIPKEKLFNAIKNEEELKENMIRNYCNEEEKEEYNN